MYVSIYDTNVCINKPYWKGSGIIIFLCKYYIAIPDTLIRLLDEFFLLLTVNQEKKIELQKKYIEEFV